MSTGAIIDLDAHRCEAMDRSRIIHTAIEEAALMSARDPAEQAYVHAEFDHLVRELEKLPALVRVHLGVELDLRARVAILEMAGQLQAIGAAYAPTPKDVA